jgi:hypothetical protein
MKVIYKMKNSLIQEFQHFLESKLIEVMKMKMQTIQFESIVNLIQRRWNEIADALREIESIPESKSGQWKDDSVEWL